MFFLEENRYSPSFQTLSSEKGADSSGLTAQNSSRDHERGDSHTPGSPVTLVKGSHQLVRQEPLGTEASAYSTLFALCHPEGPRINSMKFSCKGVGPKLLN